jgi:hypothetical protein
MEELTIDSPEWESLPGSLRTKGLIELVSSLSVQQDVVKVRSQPRTLARRMANVFTGKDRALSVLFEENQLSLNQQFASGLEDMWRRHADSDVAIARLADFAGKLARSHKALAGATDSLTISLANTEAALRGELESLSRRLLKVEASQDLRETIERLDRTPLEHHQVAFAFRNAMDGLYWSAFGAFSRAQPADAAPLLEDMKAKVLKTAESKLGREGDALLTLASVLPHRAPPSSEAVAEALDLDLGAPNPTLLPLHALLRNRLLEDADRPPNPSAPVNLPVERLVTRVIGECDLMARRAAGDDRP